MKLKRVSECLWGNIKLATDDELASCQAIVALSCGTSVAIPGTPNYEMAKICFELYLNLGIPLYLQEEIAHSVLRSCTVLPPSIFEDLRGIPSRTSGNKYKDTAQVLLEARDLCKLHLAKDKIKIVLVAHPIHIWRATETARTIGFQPCPRTDTSMPYDTYSDQLWCTAKLFCYPREIFARIFYHVKDWL